MVVRLKALVTYTIEAKPSITVNDVIVTFGASVPDLSVTTAAQNTVNWYESNKTTFIQSELRMQADKLQ